MINNNDKFINDLACSCVGTNSLVDYSLADLNWDYCLKNLSKQGLSALVHYQLKGSSTFQKLPDKFKAGLEKDYYLSAGRNAIILDQAKRLLESLKKDNVDVIVLRGLFLGQNIYKNIALRPMSDIDILVKKEDLPKINKILNSLGYITPNNYKDFINSHEPSPINTVVYWSKDLENFFVHIHWHIINTTRPLEFPLNSIDMQKIWQGKVQVSIEGVDAFGLSPEYLLTSLALHCFKHYFDKTILLVDIAFVLNYYKSNFNWDRFYKIAEDFKISFILYYVLATAAKTLKIDIGPIDGLKPKRFSLSQRLLIFISNRHFYRQALSYLSHLLVQPKILPKLVFIKRSILPSKLILAHNLGLSSSQINASHYLKRVAGNLPKFLSLKKYN